MKKIFTSVFVILFIVHNLFTPPVYAGSQTFSYTGAQQTWVVPAGITSITVDAMGGAGGLGTSGQAIGKGGRVQTTVTVTPGETLYIYVGGVGGNTGTAGYNGGGTGRNESYDGGGGGGATDIRQGGTALGNRIIVAGGGGGSFISGTGGHGGGTTGVAGGGWGAANRGGQGGTPSAGGAGGVSCCGTGGLAGGAGTAGTSGTGGNGGNAPYDDYGGGGGGGGYYGGGGGAGTGYTGGGGGGGGGSSYSSGSNTTHTQGYQTGNGSLTITYGSAPTTPTLDLPSSSATNQSLTPVLKTTATDPDSDYIQYKIEICTDSGMSANCQTFDQTSSQTGWSGQDAQTSTAYASGTQAVYTVQSALSGGTTYYWRSYAYDASIATWSATQTPRSFTTQIGDCAGVPASGNHTLSSPCAFPGSINGVDAGSGSTNTAVLTLSNGGDLSVLPGTTIAVGSVSLSGGSLIMWDTGQLKLNTPLYLPDADGDGYPTSVTSTQYTSGGAGRARRYLGLDYNDASNSVYPGTTCNGTCTVNSTTGTCDTLAAGENGLATCQRCNGSSTSVTNIAYGSQDTEGSNTCTATHYRCGGSGSCIADTTFTCYSRTSNPSGATCDAKCTAVSAGAGCTSGFSNNTCTIVAAACSSASTYCQCGFFVW